MISSDSVSSAYLDTYSNAEGQIGVLWDSSTEKWPLRMCSWSGLISPCSGYIPSNIASSLLSLNAFLFEFYFYSSLWKFWRDFFSCNRLTRFPFSAIFYESVIISKLLHLLPLRLLNSKLGVDGRYYQWAIQSKSSYEPTEPQDGFSNCLKAHDVSDFWFLRRFGVG